MPLKVIPKSRPGATSKKDKPSHIDVNNISQRKRSSVGFNEKGLTFKKYQEKESRSL